MWGLVERKCEWGLDRCGCFVGGGWTRESGGGQVRGGWIDELVYLVSVGGCVCVRVFSVGFGPGLDSMSPARSRRSVRVCLCNYVSDYLYSH